MFHDGTISHAHPLRCADDADDGGIGADAQRQREDNDQAENGPLPKIAKGVTDVPRETFHLPTLPLPQRSDVRNMMPPVPFVILHQAVERQCSDFGVI